MKTYTYIVKGNKFWVIDEDGQTVKVHKTYYPTINETSGSRLNEYCTIQVAHLMRFSARKYIRHQLDAKPKSTFFSKPW